MIRIKAIELNGIAVAAEIWYKAQSDSGFFEKELEAATNLKKQLYTTLWDEDTELFIDEMPF